MSLKYTLFEIYHTHLFVKVKVKDSRNRSGVTQRVPGDLGFQISMIFGT
jgi:hypothetical protein